MEQFDYKYEMKKIIIISAILLFAVFVFSYFFVSGPLGREWHVTRPEDFLPIFIFLIPVIVFLVLIWAAKKRNNFTGFTYQMKKRAKEKEKVRLVQHILPFVCIAIGAYIGCAAGYTINEKNRIAQRVAEEETEEKIEDEYEDLGNISLYVEDLFDNSLNLIGSDWNYHLYLKNHGGENFYYIGRDYKDEPKHILERGSWTKEEKHFNARHLTKYGNYYYTNVSAWSSSGSSSGGSTRVIHDDSPRAVQEWVPCPVCGNTVSVGLCQNCNGTGQDLYYTRDYRDCPSCGGLKKCTVCGGNGGHYETRYR